MCETVETHGIVSFTSWPLWSNAS